MSTARPGNRTGRIRQLEALFDADPRPGRQLALALAYADANQTTRAVRLLGHATERYPDHAETYVALGRLWFEEARGGDRIALGKALEALQRGASMEPTGEALGLLGEARLASAAPALAETTLRQAIEKLPADRSTFLHLADAAERAGHPAEARTALLDYHSLSADDRPPAPGRRQADRRFVGAPRRRRRGEGLVRHCGRACLVCTGAAGDRPGAAAATRRGRRGRDAGPGAREDPGNDQARALRAR